MTPLRLRLKSNEFHAVKTGKQNRMETERLQREMHNNSVYYLQAVQTMEQQIAAKDEELRVKQRVLDSLNEDVNRLRRVADKRKEE